LKNNNQIYFKTQNFIPVNQKFKNAPLEPDTVILFEKPHTIGGFEVLYQIWRWENYQGDSIIFADEDVAGIEEEEIKNLVKTDSVFLPGSGLTVKRGKSGFTFVNFNFQDVENDFRRVDKSKLPVRNSQ